MSVLDEIRKLDEQKAKLINTAREDILTAINTGIAALRDLGFHYHLVESGGSDIIPVRSPGRRSGIRDQVLQVIKNSNGIGPAAIAKALGDDSKQGKQSVSNALSALKKTGAIAQEGGLYRAK